MNCVECHNPMIATRTVDGYHFVCGNCGFEYEEEVEDECMK